MAFALMIAGTSRADWNVQIFNCSNSPLCEDIVSYVPNEEFTVLTVDPLLGELNEYNLTLQVTEPTTLKFSSKVSCDCPNALHYCPELLYVWSSAQCSTGEPCTFEQLIDAQPGYYFMQIRWGGSFRIETANESSTNIAGDFDGDGDLDVDDYNSIGTSLGLCASDTNRDSIVDFSDLLMVISDWGSTCG